MSAYRYPGPQCSYRLLDTIDFGTNSLTTCRPPGYAGNLSLLPELYSPGFMQRAVSSLSEIGEEDKAEFEHIKKMAVMDHRKRHYATLRQYMEDVTRYFGSAAEYRTFAIESDAELENTSWEVTRKGKKVKVTLRSQLEFGKVHKQQDIFYRWVRKAYKKKYGDDVDAVALIRRGMSKQLYDKLEEVRASARVTKIHDEKFHAGGFNPRPIKKKDGWYLLGTLSEHATGMAVDIDDTQNPQLDIEVWNAIEKLAGKHVERKGRWDTEKDATALWTDIKDMSDSWVKKVASEVARIEKERIAKAEKEKADKAKAGADKAPAPDAAHAGKAHAAHKELTPLHEILGGFYGKLSKWEKIGFFHLPLELVLEMRAHGFIWGATFGDNVDLHHFEIPEAKPKGASSAGAAATPSAHP